MSTTFYIIIEEKEIEVAVRYKLPGGGRILSIEWLNELHPILSDTEILAGDDGSVMAMSELRHIENNKDTEDYIKHLQEARERLSNSLQESLNREAEFRKEIRLLKQRMEICVLKREILIAKDVAVETEDFTVTIFGETRSDGQSGSFEHKKVGEDFGGGLWIGTDFNGDPKLRDYDGVGILPSQVSDALNQEGISTANIVTTNVNVR